MPLIKTEKVAKPAPVLRREPSQERSQQTIETIFKATAQIIEELGEPALSTNKIAAKAGFSVGTLYQYFPTKEAIILAMITRERARVMQSFFDTLQKAEQLGVKGLPGVAPDPHALIVELIHLLVEAFAAGRGMRRVMVRVAWQLDRSDAIAQAMREASDRISIFLSRVAAHPQVAAKVKLRTTPAALFVVTRGVMGAIRSAALEKSPLLGSPEFEAELVRLAWSQLVE